MRAPQQLRLEYQRQSSPGAADVHADVLALPSSSTIKRAWSVSRSRPRKASRSPALLNPQITWGTKIQLTNTEISNLLLTNPGLGGRGAVSPNATSSSQQAVVPVLNTDGTYYVLQVRHVGDTRGNEWYSHIIAINIDTTQSVLPNATVPIPGAS